MNAKETAKVIAANYFDDTDLAERIEMALVAEREACAKIADEGAYYGTAEGAEDMAKTIGRLIRERSQPASEQ